MLRFALATTLLLAVPASCEDAPAAKTTPAVVTQEEKTLKIELNGKPFTTYYFADGKGMDFVRPFFYPVLAADGTEVTSDQFTSNPKDHPHHRSLWVGHGNVNGADHWLLKGAATPKQRHIKFNKVAEGGFEEELEWEGKTHEPLMKETRTVRIFEYPDGSRGMDLKLVFNSIADKVTFADTKEAGLCSVRAVKAISDTEIITNAAGGTGEAACWGKPANWCDISGKINGKDYGITIFDHPENPRHPSTWHVRQYGLMAANIFALSEFNKGTAKNAGAMEVLKDKPVTFQYRVIIHSGDAKSAGLDEKYKDYTAK